MAEFTEVIRQRERMCNHIAKTKGCEECILYSENNVQNVRCDVFLHTYPEEAENIIMGWAAVHPAMTNAQKFKEVFGLDIAGNCSGLHEMYCNKVFGSPKCNECKFRTFWEDEYREPEGK